MEGSSGTKNCIAFDVDVYRGVCRLRAPLYFSVGLWMSGGIRTRDIEVYHESTKGYRVAGGRRTPGG